MAATQGGLAGNETADGPCLPAVFIAAGEPADKVTQRENAQLSQRLGLGLADALDVAHIGIQVRHAAAPFQAK